MKEKMIAKLYELVDAEDITVFSASCPNSKALCIRNDITGKCYIILDKNNPKENELELLAHELGHCMTGAFCNPNSPLDINSKHEYRACKWEIEQLIPKQDMEDAFECGIVEAWELAEYFNVSEKLIKKAAYIYFDKYIP